jgi:type 1 glutamine amidotransferase
MRKRAGQSAVWSVLASAALLGAAFCKAAETAPLRVLLLSGQSNHDWTSTTPKLEAILERDGSFEVDVREPGRLTPEALAPYDVILSNWNAYGLDPVSSTWPEAARSAYLGFVRQGKGHVVVHAGSASFPDWDDYLRLTLATWKAGRSSHGPVHEFPVRIDDPDHPITAGLSPFTIKDELWNKPGTAEGAEVLASSFSAAEKEGTGEWEPAVLAGRFGKGRSLTILLGHDAAAMDNPGFQALLRRGVEWAATGRVRSPSPAAAMAKGWHWEKNKGTSLALVGPAGPLWRFRYGAGLDTPYFHPLNTADGRTLTWDRPPDHVWHHGLWFSWKFIDGVNYWEIDAKTGRPAGRTTWSNVKVEARKDLGARIALDLAYRPGDGTKPALTEKRTITVSPPDGEGGYALDWTCEFRPVLEVVLDRTPLPGEPGGQSWGGYAGLSLRFAGDLAERVAVTSDGPIAEAGWREDRYRGRHEALDYSAMTDGKTVGIAILDHPSNPRSPTPWYVIRSAEMSFFSPALLCYGPMTLKAGQRWTLRYRVIVHQDRWDAARLKAEYEEFSRGMARTSTRRIRK